MLSVTRSQDRAKTYKTIAHASKSPRNGFGAQSALRNGTTSPSSTTVPHSRHAAPSSRTKGLWFAILIVDTENDTRPMLHKTQHPIHFVSLCNELHERQHEARDKSASGPAATVKSRAGFIEDIVRSTLQNSQKSKQSNRKRRPVVSDIEMLRARLEQLGGASVAATAVGDDDVLPASGDELDDDVVVPAPAGADNVASKDSAIVDDEEDLSAFFSFHIDACEHCCTTCMSDAINRSLFGTNHCSAAKDATHRLFYYRSSSTPVLIDDDEKTADTIVVPPPEPATKRARVEQSSPDTPPAADPPPSDLSAPSEHRCPRCSLHSDDVAAAMDDDDDSDDDEESLVWNVGRYRIGQINGPFREEHDAEKYIKMWSSGKRGTISKAARGEVLATHFKCETYGDLRVIFLNDDAGNYIACSCTC